MPKTKEQNDAIKLERKEKILLKALEIFSCRGYAASRISDIARAVGMSQGLIYHYWSSKEDIYEELIERAMQRLVDACRELEKSDETAAHKIVSALQALISGMESNPQTPQYYLLIAMASASDITPPQVRRIILKNRLIPYEIMTRIFARGQAEGTVNAGDPAKLATLFWTTITGLAIYTSSHGEQKRYPEIEMILKLFIKE